MKTRLNVNQLNHHRYIQCPKNEWENIVDIPVHYRNIFPWFMPGVHWRPVGSFQTITSLFVTVLVYDFTANKTTVVQYVSMLSHRISRINHPVQMLLILPALIYVIHGN